MKIQFKFGALNLQLHSNGKRGNLAEIFIFVYLENKIQHRCKLLFLQHVYLHLQFKQNYVLCEGSKTEQIYGSVMDLNKSQMSTKVKANQCIYATFAHKLQSSKCANVHPLYPPVQIQIKFGALNLQYICRACKHE